MRNRKNSTQYQTLYAILAGENEELAIAELKALLETYEIAINNLNCYTMICVFEVNLTDKHLLEVIAERASSIEEIGALIAFESIYKPRYDYISGIDSREYTWIKPSVYKFEETSIVREYFLGLSKLLKLPLTYRRGLYLHVMISDGIAFIGKPLIAKTSKGFNSRKPSKRPFFRSIALPPSISRLLVNLARVKEGGVLLDPFLGTGSIAIEAGLMGIRVIGAEIDKELVRGAYINIEYFKLGSTSIVINGDSTILTYNGIDGVATDPPYGRAASTHGYEIKELYSQFIERMSESLRRGKYLVFMAPLWLEEYIDEKLCKLGFMIKGKYYYYVHGGLTRVIYEAFKYEY
ncbi:MAG: TRM11 family methyltransferase [Thermoprotei archaeon]